MKNNIIKYLKIGLVILSVFSVVFIIFSTQQVKILSTTPSKNEENVPETNTIQFTFDSSISDKSKGGITISPTPSFEFETEWSGNVYNIIPTNKLQNDTEYTINLYLKNKLIYTLQFKTSLLSQEEILNNTSIQTYDDLLYGKALINIDTKYPFYKNLPIRTQYYVVYYDFDKEKFAITFLTTISDLNEKERLIKEALVKIKEIGGKEPIGYYTNP